LSDNPPFQSRLLNVSKQSFLGEKYGFVDFVRFVSMVGVVWLHSYITLDRETFGIGTDHPLLFIFTVQFWKFSTICFFLISGFLLSTKLNIESGFTFFKNRLANIFKPYLVAFSITFLYYSIIVYVRSSELKPAYVFFNLLFNTSFWFVPNLLFALLLIIVLIKATSFTYTGIIAAILLIVNTIQNAYIHHEQHTFAFFAFAFYLWLGMLIQKENLIERINTQRFSIVLTLLIASFAFAFYETYWWAINKNPYPFNSLYFTNQLFSILAFILLVRLSRKVYVLPFINPRKETFGIYLYHVIVLSIIKNVLHILERFLHIRFYSLRTIPTLAITVGSFVIAYSITTLLVRYCVRKKYLFLST
jgi:hypothetical protein